MARRKVKKKIIRKIICLLLIGVIALAGYERYKHFDNKESIKDSPINNVFNNKNSKEPKEKVPEEYKISLLDS